MSALDTTTFANVQTSTGFKSVVASLIASVSAWNDTRMTRKSLAKLSDRELDDIGLSRGDIDAINF